MSSNNDTKFSKRLCYLLRHGAEKEKIEMRNDGYVKVKDILLRKEFSGINIDYIKTIVKENDKQRFNLIEENGIYLIRANQGHTLKTVDVEMTELTLEEENQLPKQCIHGTYKKYVDAIIKNGLNKMERQHIHFAPGLLGEENVISGMRKNCEILIYIDLKKALNDGIKFYSSENGVILSSGINGIIKKDYFLKIIDLKSKKEITF